jgi:flagellar hook-associated protein 1 FlgK
MIPTFSGLETALSGLQAYQAAIDTVGQNIANVNTPGYSRQSVNLTERSALALPAMSSVNGAGGQLGLGVDISSISRIRNQFLDTQYRAQSATSGATTQASTDVASAQSALNEPSASGISAQLQSFWSAWNGVATNPTGSAAPAALQTLIGTATTLAQSFNSVDAQLSTVQTDATNQLSTLTGASGQLQTDANQIAALNGQIAQSTAAGQTPNDLLDQRDQLLDGLSGLANVSVTTQSNGMVNVNLATVNGAGGTTPYSLVSGTTATSLPQPPPPLNFSGGQLGALYNDASPTGPIGTLRSSLDNVANQLVTTVNKLQPTSPFFNPAGTTAGSIAVVATASTVQTSSSSTSGADLATQIAALQGGAADQSYSAFVGQVGNAVQSAQSTSATASSMLSSIDNQRQSVSGVSLDEEMTNMITYQQGYQASAKMMNTMDAMFNTLINNTGL